MKREISYEYKEREPIKEEREEEMWLDHLANESRIRNQRDEAKQAAKDNPPFITTKVAGGYDHFDTQSSETYHESDICPSDEGNEMEEDND